jgi:hypothetical protein
VGRAAQRVAVEKKKEKKDAEKARARERMRAREALERRRRRQERDGLSRESSPETPDDDDDDDDEDDDMAARLGFILDLRLGQGSPSQPPSGLAPSVSGAGTPRSRSEERRQAEGVLDPLAKVVEVTPGSQADPPVPQKQAPVPAAQEVGPPAVVTTPRRAAPSVPRAPEVEAAPESAAGLPSAAPAGAEARGGSPQARLALVRSGSVSEDTSALVFSPCVLILSSLFLSASGGRARLVWPLGRPSRRNWLLQLVSRRARLVGWPPRKAPLSGGPGRRVLPWGKLPKLTPLSGRPSCRRRMLARPWPKGRLTCCRRRRRLPPGPSLIRPWSHPSLPTSGWLMCHRSWSSLTSPFSVTRRGQLPSPGLVIRGPPP